MCYIYAIGIHAHAHVRRARNVRSVSAVCSLKNDRIKYRSLPAINRVGGALTRVRIRTNLFERRRTMHEIAV